MPIKEQQRTLLRGLSDFWQRFFADSDQLDAMYVGTEILLGQTYLDMVANVVNVSMLDAPVFNKEYWKLITIREDEILFEKGASVNTDRWVYTLKDGVVKVQLLDNKVVDPTSSLQDPQDFQASNGALRFVDDPTDDGAGNPAPGFAFRKVDIVPGGALSDSGVANWLTSPVKKGDIVRLIDQRITKQVKLSDHQIVVVRKGAIYVSGMTPFAAPATSVKYVILRKPYNNAVSLESLSFTTPQYTVNVIEGVQTQDTRQLNVATPTSALSRTGYSHTSTGYSATAQLAHVRIVEGSVRIYAKNLDGEDVEEGVDYEVDYEAGKIIKLKPWASYSINKIDYQWYLEVYPAAGPSPRLSTTGTITKPNSVRVTQIATWSPDVLVDRETLYNNFGSLIGVKAASSESYRAFLRGVFQLYMLGPVLERIESALNVILGFPVIRDDDEILAGYDSTDLFVNKVTTTRPNGQTAVYLYPKTAPIRTDVTDIANVGVLTFRAFEHITTSATVTDYIQDPTWWHRITLPKDVFATEASATVPSYDRRTVTPLHYPNVLGGIDNAQVGDPGFNIGADDEGIIPGVGHPIFRKKMAFVLMDRFLKTHMFFVRFDNDVFVDTDEGVQFANNPDELRALVFDSKPAYTYLYVQPTTAFVDEAVVAEEDYYQPQRFVGADPNSPEIRDFGDLEPGEPSVLLGLFLSPIVASEDQVLFADAEVTIGSSWAIGDYFTYTAHNEVMSFPTIGVPVAITPTPGVNKQLHVVRTRSYGSIGGKALVENVDYTVNYTTREITRLTAWDSASAQFRFLLIDRGNTTTTSLDVTVGDREYQVNMLEPETARAAYDPAALDLFGTPWPVTDHRDLSCVENALIIKQL